MGKNFKNHVATVLLENEDFFILNWQDKKGSNEYQIRYVLDKKEGTLYLSGDLGSCVACWYNRVIPENLAGFMNNIGYFLEKCECSSDNFIRTEEQIEKDVDVLREENKADLEEKFEGEELEKKLSELKDDFDEVEYFLSCEAPKTGDLFLSNEIIEIFEKYYGGDWGEVAQNLGKTIHPRVFLWTEGFQLALKQLGRI